MSHQATIIYQCGHKGYAFLQSEKLAAGEHRHEIDCPKCRREDAALAVKKRNQEPFKMKPHKIRKQDCFRIDYPNGDSIVVGYKPEKDHSTTETIAQMWLDRLNEAYRLGFSAGRKEGKPTEDRGEPDSNGFYPDGLDERGFDKDGNRREYW